jgi:hypothetical protein
MNQGISFHAPTTFLSFFLSSHTIASPPNESIGRWWWSDVRYDIFQLILPTWRRRRRVEFFGIHVHRPPRDRPEQTDQFYYKFSETWTYHYYRLPRVYWKDGCWEVVRINSVSVPVSSCNQTVHASIIITTEQLSGIHKTVRPQFSSHHHTHYYHHHHHDHVNFSDDDDDMMTIVMTIVLCHSYTFPKMLTFLAPGSLYSFCESHSKGKPFTMLLLGFFLGLTFNGEISFRGTTRKT